MRKFALLVITITLSFLVGCTADDGPNDVDYDIDPRLEADVEAGATPNAVVTVEEGAEDELRAYSEEAGVDVDIFPEFGLANVYDVYDMELIREMFRRGFLKRADADEHYYPTSSPAALELIRQPEAISTGHDGAGVTVAVIDSGLDYTHSDFGTCTAPNTRGCRVLDVRDFAPEDNELDDAGRHGSNVAAVVASVAPAAELIGLDVFDGRIARSTDIISALSWVNQNASSKRIKVVNLSLGGSIAYTSTCDNSGVAIAVRTVVSSGISVVSASGNDAFKDSMTSPGCISESIAVGAVYPASRSTVTYEMCEDATPDKDQITCFSNASSELDLVAPGVAIPGAGAVMTGTSQATPHVAGVAAILHSADALATPARVRQALEASPTTLTDSANGAAYPRLDAEAALFDLVGAPTPTQPTPQQPAPEPEPACEPTIALSTQSPIDSEGDVIDAIVSAGSDCSWQLGIEDSWLRAEATSGTGDAIVEIVILENLGDERTATIQLGPELLAITQSAGDYPENYALIEGGLPRTSSTTVTVDVSTIYGDRASAVCVSTTTSCTNWMPSSSQVTVQLPAIPGNHTVSVWILAPNVLPSAILVTDEIERL